MSVNRRELAGIISIYSVVIVMLFLLSVSINSTDARYILIAGFSLSISLSLIVLALGAVLSIYGKNRMALILRTFIFWSVLLFFAVFEAISRIMTGYELQFTIPLFLFLESIMLYYFGNWAVSRGHLYYSGLTVKDIGGSLFLLSIGLFLYADQATRVYSFFFYPVGIYLFIYSFTAVLTASKTDWKAGLGRYFIKYGSNLSGSSIVVGILLVVYEFPKVAFLNDVILTVILLISLFVILGVSWRIYSSTSSRIKKLSSEVFVKHRKSAIVFSDKSLDSVMSTVNEFRLKGEKEKLIITLTMVLAAAGRTVEDCNVILRSLISYKIPDPLLYKRFSIRSRLEREIMIRDRILKEIVKEMRVDGVDN